MLELDDQLDRARSRCSQQDALEKDARNRKATLAFLLDSTQPSLRAEIEQSISKLSMWVREGNRLKTKEWTETEQLVEVILELVLDSRRTKQGKETGEYW